MVDKRSDMMKKELAARKVDVASFDFHAFNTCDRYAEIIIGKGNPEQVSNYKAFIEIKNKYYPTERSLKAAEILTKA